MLKFFPKVLLPPVFEEEEKTFAARMTHYVLLGSIVLGAVWMVAALRLSPPEYRNLNIIANVMRMLFWVLLLVVLRQGYVNITNTLTIIIYIASLNIQAYMVGGIYSPVIFANIIPLSLSVLLMTRRVAWVSILTVASIWGLLYIDKVYPATIIQPIAQNLAFIYTMIVLMSGFILQMAASNLRAVLNLEKRDRAEIAEKNRQLQSFSQNLEKLVAERTADLENATLQIERRASQLQAIAQVARSITSIQDVEQLLMQITRVIGDEFGFYHVGIFIINASDEYAELRAASSAGGEKMLARNHRLRVGVEGIVGTVAAIGRARIALDVGGDAIYFNNPDLPDTHSEIALPLIVAGKTIGVLDMQSDQRGAFSNSDIDILTTLANQIAVAIENARLFGQTRQALAEAQRANQEFISNEWSSFSGNLNKPGYRFTGLSTEPLRDKITVSEIEDTARTGQSHKSTQTLAIPVKLRGQTIGVIGLRTKSNTHEWTREEVNVAQAAADRVALALENARLIEDSQKRAKIEKMTSDISSRIGSSVRFETILRTAAEEISRALDGSEVLVQLHQGPSAENSANRVKGA